MKWALAARDTIADTFSKACHRVIGLRIASEKQFDRYFGLSVPSDEISEDELQELLRKMSNRIELQAKLADLSSRGLLEHALDRLDYHRYALDRTDPIGVLTSLLSLDVHGQDGFFMVPFSPQLHIWRIVYAYIRGESSLAQRAKYLAEALRAASSLRTTVAISQRSVDHSESHTSGPDMLLESGADIDAIKAAIVSKINSASSEAHFADGPELVLWLQIWKAWGGTDEPTRWAKALCAYPGGFPKFLRAFVTTARSQGSSPLIKEHQFFVLANLEEFVDLTVIRAELGNLNILELSDDDQKLVALLQRALARRDAGELDYTALSWTWENATQN